MALADTITAITYTIAKKEFPNLWMDQDIVTAILRKKGTKMQAGERIQVPVRHAAFPVENYVGMEPSDLSRREFATTAYYPWGLKRVPLVYAGEDVLRNSGNKQAIKDFAKSLVKNGADSLSDGIASDFFGTGNDTAGGATMPGFIGFKHIANSGDAAHGGVDAMGTGVTLGTISKTTYPWWSGWTLGLGGSTHALEYTWLSLGMAKTSDGKKQIKLVAMHPEVLHGFKRIEKEFQRYNDSRLAAGFLVTSVDGVEIYSDRHVPVDLSTGYTTNVAFGIDTDHIDLFTHEARSFSMEPFVKIPDRDGYVGYFQVAGNLITDDPSRHIIWHDFEHDAVAA